MSEPLVEQLRGGLVEAIHRGDLALVDSAGTLRASVGDPEAKLTYWRSAAKPFQALPVIRSGAARRWDMSPQDLALISGSHNGEPVHVAQASALLARIGCDVSDLRCGVHPPLAPEAAAELRRAGVEPTELHHNCSGNHIGMLALAEHLGADRAGYQLPGHPVQTAILDSICDFSGLPRDAVTVGVDGCGVPCFGTSVYHLAYAFARLMDPGDLSHVHSRAAREIRTAVAAHPYLVAGHARLDTDLMRVGDVIAKGGASGVQCVGLPEGMGLAVKIEDGSMGLPPSPGAVATIAALQQLKILDEAQVTSLSAHARPVVRTATGLMVGETRPTFDLTLNQGH
ncbi:MAG: asparaginase [Actinomycetota bacterium]|nr:asparaginase [Actinomycetota bacterium]